MIGSIIVFYLAYALFIALFDPEKLCSSWIRKIAISIAFPGLLLMVGLGLLLKRFPIIGVITGYAVLGFGIFFIVTALLILFIESYLMGFCFFLVIGIMGVILFFLGRSNEAK